MICGSAQGNLAILRSASRIRARSLNLDVQIAGRKFRRCERQPGIPPGKLSDDRHRPSTSNLAVPATGLISKTETFAGLAQTALNCYRRCHQADFFRATKRTQGANRTNRFNPSLCSTSAARGTRAELLSRPKGDQARDSS